MQNGRKIRFFENLWRHSVRVISCSPRMWERNFTPIQIGLIVLKHYRFVECIYLKYFTSLLLLWYDDKSESWMVFSFPSPCVVMWLYLGDSDSLLYTRFFVKMFWINISGQNYIQGMIIVFLRGISWFHDVVMMFKGSKWFCPTQANFYDELSDRGVFTGLWPRSVQNRWHSTDGSH